MSLLTSASGAPCTERMDLRTENELMIAKTPPASTQTATFHRAEVSPFFFNGHIPKDITKLPRTLL